MRRETYQSDIPELPDDLPEALRILEDKLSIDQERLELAQPDPLMPIGARIAYTLAQARLAADSDVIAELHRQMQPETQQ